MNLEDLKKIKDLFNLSQELQTASMDRRVALTMRHCGQQLIEAAEDSLPIPALESACNLALEHLQSSHRRDDIQEYLRKALQK